MHVIATAGHVDHGKSTLIRLLTGMEPDRFAEERRRGLTIDLGFAWTTLSDGCTIAFVDVPGHGRFVPTMLAGVGSTPAVMFVVAADEGWMPQSTEHLDALNALGVEHGVLVVTRCDLSDPEPATTEALGRLRETSLAAASVVHVSGSTGRGRESLLGALDDLVHRIPRPDPNADTRLWIDRVFTIRGAGTVVTGTLRAGTLHIGDELSLPHRDTRVTVRGLHRLGAAETDVFPVSRVGVNLRGVPVDRLRRGDALLTPGRWRPVELIDVRLRHAESALLPRELMLHVGSTSTSVRIRPLGTDTARLSLRTALPLRIGDRALLRDPGSRRIVSGLSVLDVRPPRLRRRGDARDRARDLATREASPDGRDELARRGLIRVEDLRFMGAAPPPDAARTGSWLMDDTYREELGTRLVKLVERHQCDHPLSAGLARETARHVLGLPEQDLVGLVLGTSATSVITVHEGRLRIGTTRFPEHVRRALDILLTELHHSPFHAPTSDRLADLGLGEPELAAAVRGGELLRLGPKLVLLPDAERQAVEALAALPAPFTVSQARKQLETSRRVAVPLMEALARDGYTERLADGRHRLRI